MSLKKHVKDKPQFFECAVCGYRVVKYEGKWWHMTGYGEGHNGEMFESIQLNKLGGSIKCEMVKCPECEHEKEVDTRCTKPIPKRSKKYEPEK